MNEERISLKIISLVILTTLIVSTITVAFMLAIGFINMTGFLFTVSVGAVFTSMFILIPHRFNPTNKSEIS